jgi:hypothetical protein
MQITKTQPSRHNEYDFVAWFPKENGMFIVRSVYCLRLYREMIRQDRESTSAQPDGENPSWKLIWGCPVPPKAKVLAWKICRNALATELNMQRRGEG